MKKNTTDYYIDIDGQLCLNPDFRGNWNALCADCKPITESISRPTEYFAQRIKQKEKQIKEQRKSYKDRPKPSNVGSTFQRQVFHRSIGKR